MRVDPRLLVGSSLLVLAGGCSADDAGGAPEAAPSSTVQTLVPALPKPVSAADAPVTPLSKLETDRIQLDSPDWMAYEDKSLWVRLDPGTIVRVDPRSGKVEAEIEPSGDGESSTCQAFGSSPGSIWSCSSEGVLQRVDASANETSASLDVTVSKAQGHLVAADSRLWVLDPDGQSMSGVDLETNALGDPINLGIPCTELAASGSLVWAACPWDDQVLRVDVTIGEITARLHLPEPRQLVVGDELWVTSAKGIAQIDPESLAVVALYDVEVGYGAAVAPGKDSVWARSDGGPFLYGIDPDRHEVFAVVIAKDLPSGGNTMEIDGQLWATAFDDAALVRLEQPTVGSS